MSNATFHLEKHHYKPCMHDIHYKKFKFSRNLINSKYIINSLRKVVWRWVKIRWRKVFLRGKAKKINMFIYKYKYNIRFFFYDLIIMEKMGWDVTKNVKFSNVFFFWRVEKSQFFLVVGHEWKMISGRWSGWRGMRGSKTSCYCFEKRRPLVIGMFFMAWYEDRISSLQDAPLTMNFQVGSYLHRIGQDIYKIQLVISATPLYQLNQSSSGTGRRY